MTWTKDMNALTSGLVCVVAVSLPSWDARDL